MADDQAQTILSPAQAENSAKADAWEAFHSAQNENELGVRLQGMKLPQDVKAQLWEAKKSSSFQIPDANAQARAIFQKGGALWPGRAGMGEPWTPKNYLEKDAAMDQILPPGGEGDARVKDMVSQIRKGALGIGGASFGAGAVEAGGTGLLPALMRMGGSGVGGAIGNATGDAVSGKVPDPKETMQAGGIYAGSQGLGELLGLPAKFLGKQVAKLSGETPERLATLKALPAQEAAINQKVVQAEAASRTAFKNAYDSMGIDAAPVNVAATKNLAKQAASKIVSSGVPAPVSRVAAIPEPSANVLTSDDPATILKELSSFDNIPFRKAQLYRTAIEQYISRAGGKLPSDVYGQLKAVSGSLGDGLKATAAQEGKAAEFSAAESAYKQHAADFWNKGAPLKGLVNTPPDATGQTLNKFMQTANRARITQALERRGVDTSDIKAMLAQGDKPLKANIRDAAKIQQLGPDVFNQQVGAANKAAVKGVLKKYAGGAIGAGTLYEIYKILSGDGGTNTSAIKP